MVVAKKRDELLGKIYKTNNCGECFIIDYQKGGKLKVMFYDGTIVKCSLKQLQLGNVRNQNAKTVRGIGYFGYGKYSYSKNRELTCTWRCLIGRVGCIDNYEDVTLCEEWLCFQNFAEWYVNQKGYDLGWQIDKDIIVKGNRHYSPETCALVPQNINNLFTKSDNNRGDCPLGVSKVVLKCGLVKYITDVHDLNGTRFKFRSDTVEEAFMLYKTHKEARIKHIAEQYKDQIDDRVYNAMMNWVVEITD